MSAQVSILELLKRKKPLFSVEFFPPKDEAGMESLRQVAQHLKAIGPDFVSVTYGAGGSTRQRTTDVCRLLRDEMDFIVMPHLTCVGSSRQDLLDIIGEYHREGFRNIMALRGDPPRGQTTFEPYKDGLRYASDLVALIRRDHADFCLGVGGYPEKHPEAPDLATDIAHLKTKMHAGGDFITTQLFFRNEVYFDFVNRCRKIGIAAPMIPGIMPVLSLKQIQRFTEMCGASLPKKLVAQLQAAGGDAEKEENVGIAWALQQIKELLAGGAPGIHLYILNRSRAALHLVQSLRKELGR
ncbi:MAG: methylenetetrahydrofolate reductase [NAD(P)H] [bacterium]